MTELTIYRKHVHKYAYLTVDVRTPEVVGKVNRTLAEKKKWVIIGDHALIAKEIVTISKVEE